MKQIKKVVSNTMIALTVIVSLGYVFTCQAQQPERKTNANNVTIYLKNNSMLPQKVTLISYQPGENTNGTNGFLLMPYASRKYTFAQGTKLYLAGQKQVDTVMGGGTLTNEPFLTLKQEDNGKVFKISK